MVEEYRFDDESDSVYGYNDFCESYNFIGTYHAWGITVDMPDKEKAQHCQEYDDERVRKRQGS